MTSGGGERRWAAADATGDSNQGRPAAAMNDPHALRILFDTYWAAGQWREGPPYATPPADLAYAKQAGVMFDPVAWSHDEVVRRAVEAAAAVDRAAVADAFVVSLASRRLELRSALGTYAVARHLRPHPAPPPREQCDVCGTYDDPAEPEDLNVLNFERFKWGGVRHDDPLYAAFDLALFARLPRESPTPDDARALRDLLAAIEAAPPTTTAGAL